MNIKPTGHHVIIDPDEVEETTESGIVISANMDTLAREKAATTRGHIVAVGPTAWSDPGLGGKPWAKVGDYVFYTRHVSKTITDTETGKDYFLLTDDNVLAIIEEAPEEGFTFRTGEKNE